MTTYHYVDFPMKESKMEDSEQAYPDFYKKEAKQAYLNATLNTALDAAMKEAKQAYTKKTYPVGAVIVNPDGKIISRGHNHVYSEDNEDFTAHAEIEAIRNAGSQLMQKGNFEQCTLYTTWEPCLMCCGAILLARIKHVVWVMNDDLHGGLRLLHKDKKFFNSPYYRDKLFDLEISAVDKFSAVNAQDLLNRMENWMNDWNEKKKTVLSQ